MSLSDEIIRRWLNQAASDAAPRLERASEEGAIDMESNEFDAQEVARQLDRLRLVQGLLGTLDLKTAPDELAALVEANAGEEAVDGDSDLNEWLESNDLEVRFETVLGPQQAPEFLDRIVEQRFAAMEESLFLGNSKEDTGANTSRWTSSRRAMAGAVLALLVLVVPVVLGDSFGGNRAQDEITNLRLVSYDSLEGLQKAFPNQSKVAQDMGILGAFGAPGNGMGDPR
jgi:hypothetical protein